MLAATVVFVAAVVGAAIALVIGQRAGRLGLNRGFGLRMAASAVVFAVGLTIGTTALPSSWAFWAPLAVAVAMPCLIGAWHELPQ